MKVIDSTLVVNSQEEVSNILIQEARKKYKRVHHIDIANKVFDYIK